MDKSTNLPKKWNLHDPKQLAGVLDILMPGDRAKDKITKLSLTQNKYTTVVYSG